MSHLFVWVIFMVMLAGVPGIVLEATATRVHLVRHGETLYNQQGRLQGHTDISLSDVGRAQAEEAKARWQGVALTAGYSSDLMRARETLQLLVEGRELPLNEDARLRERSFGRFEGLLVADFRQQASPDDKDIESNSLLLARMLSALEEIAQRHPGEEVLVVSHGSAIRMVLVHISGENNDSFHPENLGSFSLSYDTGTWSINE